MIANPLTDQLAAGVREVAATDPAWQQTSILAARMAAAMKKSMPDMPPQAIGAVGLHASSYLGGLILHAAERRGTGPERSAVLAVNVMAIAAEMLYTTPADTTTEQAPTVPCDSRAHRDFVGDQDIRCQLPAGHQAHRNGTRQWQP